MKPRRGTAARILWEIEQAGGELRSMDALRRAGFKGREPSALSVATELPGSDLFEEKRGGALYLRIHPCDCMECRRARGEKIDALEWYRQHSPHPVTRYR